MEGIDMLYIDNDLPSKRDVLTSIWNIFIEKKRDWNEIVTETPDHHLIYIK